MHIKRFEAGTLEEALAAVKRELGPDALILSTRTLRRGGPIFGLMGGRRVEVQAARERGPGRASARVGADGPAGDLARCEADFESKSNPGAQEPRSEVDARGEGDGLVRGVDGALVEALRGELSRWRDRERFEEEVRSELRGLRRALAGVLGERVPDAADPLVRRLAGGGLDWVHAEGLVASLRDPAGSGQAHGIGMPGLLRRRLESKLAPPRPDEGSRVRVLVGAPGVGKTTTLAKLAARDEEGEREVALVALDHYRIGAPEQLRAYADLLDSPFCEVGDASELPRVVDRLRGRAVLVDTAGRGPRDEEALASLRPIRDLLGRRVSIELVVDATARREVQRAQLARFAALSPDRVILAKTDECDSLADVANLVLDADCPPVCWMGTGQRVPEDLELVEPGRLVQAVLGEAA
ncbi:MAG TPA: flagellar biosynthesis protein FlhF [Myxococcota bacterium]|nr:flagellar biosynthesis protein FlhF [Myxococcales bacterium]HPG25952.1 flagellar biosynthesis protein FlhF [Myxococcota bacterium]